MVAFCCYLLYITNEKSAMSLRKRKNYMNELKELQDLLTDQKKMLKLVKNELRRAPDGTLLIQMSRGHPVYLRVKMSGPDRIRQGIGRKPALVSALALVLYSLYTGRAIYLDIALVVALLGFVGTVFVARYLEGRL